MTFSANTPIKKTREDIMKTSRFKIVCPEVKRRGHLPPPTIRHADKRNQYCRKNFKDARNWD